MNKIRFISTLLVFTATSLAAYAQADWIVGKNSLEAYPSIERMEAGINALCSIESARAGRDANGCTGGTEYIGETMLEAGLSPVNGSSFIQCFTTSRGEEGANVIGMLEGFRRLGSRKYIIVGAHYDNLGIINGKFYPGADSNASAVAAMLEIAGAFRKQRNDYNLYNGNLIFVAFDRYLDGRAGSEAFWKAVENGELIDPVSHTAITPGRICAMIDLDQLGCTLAPIEKGTDNYMIAIGENTFPSDKQGILERCNDFYDCALMLSDSYYGSARFTKAFYTLGDRRIFIEHGIPTIFFTSGITDNNNRVSDTPETINYEVLRRRAILIFRFIEKIF